MLFIIDFLIYAFIPLGLWFSFRIMRYADLAIEQVFVLGGVITALALNNYISLIFIPLILIFCSILLSTINSFLRYQFNIHPIILSLIMFYTYYSISLTLMKKPSLDLLTEQINNQYLLTLLIIVYAFLFLFFIFFFKSKYGIQLKASASNVNLAQKLGINKIIFSTIGLSISYFCLLIGGMFYTLKLSNSDINYGTGLLLMALFVVVFTRFFNKRINILKNMLFILVVSMFYLMLLQIVIMLNVPTSLLRGIYAFFLLILIILLPKEEFKLFN